MKEVMIIMIKKTKKKICKFIFLPILCCLFLGCNHSNSELYDIVVHENDEGFSVESPVIIPITDGKDSVYCCICPLNFYKDMNIYLFNETEFTLRLYKYIIEDKYILISSSLMKYYNTGCNIVTENMDIKHIYKSKGIRYLLNTYLTKHGEMPYDKLSVSQINYLYYLSFINHIYYYFNDEDGGYYVSGDFWNKK